MLLLPENAAFNEKIRRRPYRVFPSLPKATSQRQARRCSRKVAPTMPLPHYQTSPLLLAHGFRHAFFERGGGVSRGPYQSLNFSYAVGDDSDCVAMNFARAADVLGVPAERIFFLSQEHGNRCVELHGDEKQQQTWQREGDAVVSGMSGLACAVRTADCIPVLLADPHTGRVAAAHAGWRGLVCHVLRNACRALAARPERLLAAIGPHISHQAFEVGPDVAEQLANCSPDGASAVEQRGAKHHVNLRALAQAQLCELGLERSRIDQVPGCTFREPERYFSFRRDGRHSGRHLSAIVPLARPNATSTR